MYVCMHVILCVCGVCITFSKKKKKTRAYILLSSLRKPLLGDFLGGPVVENLPANAGDTGSIPSPGRSHMPQSN